MNYSTIRPYEMSVWTLRDTYIASLRVPGVENKGQIEAINLDFVIRIREYPKNKKGKNKSVVLD